MFWLTGNTICVEIISLFVAILVYNVLFLNPSVVRLFIEWREHIYIPLRFHSGLRWDTIWHILSYSACWLWGSFWPVCKALWRSPSVSWRSLIGLWDRYGSVLLHKHHPVKEPNLNPNSLTAESIKQPPLPPSWFMVLASSTHLNSSVVLQLLHR